MNRKLNVFLTGLASVAIVSGLLSTTGCSKNDNDAPPPSGFTSDTLSGSISQDVTLRSGNTYYLNGVTFIKSGFTLKIEPGVVIKAIKGTKAVLVITRGAKIDAQGTSSQPIVFTSNQAAGARHSGDWGGIVLLGKAKVNSSTTISVADGGGSGTRIVEGFDNAEIAAYGGSIVGGGGASPDDADNSGVMKHVRIEFPGIALSSTANSELNGLTMVALGSTTVLDYIQVSYSGDDSFEWFGGTVNAKHLIAYRGLDDDFDTDNGYTGKVQFAFSVRDNTLYDVGTAASNGFESDNEDPTPAILNTPITAPVFSNVTLVGPGAFVGNANVNAAFGRAALIRRGSRLSIYNSVLTGWKDGINVADDFSNGSANSGDLQVKNTYLVGFTDARFIYSSFASGQTGGINAGTLLLISGNENNTTLAGVADLNLSNLVLGASINITPLSTSQLLNKASFTAPKLSGLTQVNYVGAFAVGDTWATSWTHYDPQNATY